MSKPLYEIWVKKYSIHPNTVRKLLEKYPNLWSYGPDALRTTKKSIANQVKKELERYFGSNVYITER